jgi:hypothetical protein
LDDDIGVTLSVGGLCWNSSGYGGEFYLGYQVGLETQDKNQRQRKIILEKKERKWNISNNSSRKIG